MERDQAIAALLIGGAVCAVLWMLSSDEEKPARAVKPNGKKKPELEDHDGPELELAADPPHEPEHKPAPQPAA